MKKAFPLILMVAVVLGMTGCSKKKSSFAIVIDPQSYQEAQAEIDQYQQVVRNRGLEPILVIDRWGVPDSIRAELQNLYNQKEAPIEGAVFIGDIPVVMVRDAQHMTTAFKMDQERFPEFESSVPSDRFYDDFDLQFRYLHKDSVRPGTFYYSLMAEGVQKLKPEIYTARIFPRTNQGGEKYEKLRRYMKRANEADAQNNPIDHLFFFSGNGFISESLDARIDEKNELYDQFPWLRKQEQSIEYIDHGREKFVKNRVINQMQYKNLDFAVLHHHGSPAIEHLSGYPDGDSFAEQIDMLKMYLRMQMRHGKDYGRTEADMKQRLRKYVNPYLPDQWFEKSFDQEQMIEDSLFDRKLNLYAEDFQHYHPQTRFVILDACYNGSFHQDESIQECYLFGEGNGTLLVMGNSVNVLQDKWVNRYIGLLGLGMRAGHMAQLGCYLEAHLFGDPTFSFTPATKCFDINEAILYKGKGFWEKQLDSKFPDVQILAMEKLTESKKNYSDRIYQQFRESPYGIVRLAAMLELSKYNDANYIRCLSEALNDSHEMTQRFATNLCNKSGNAQLVEPLVKLASSNNTSERIEFNLSNTLRMFEKDTVLAAFDRYYPTVEFYSYHDSIGKLIRHALESYTTQLYDEVKYILKDTFSIGYRIQLARMLRNSNLHYMVPDLLEFLQKPQNVQLQTNLWEALGWFNQSYRAPEIREAAQRIASDSLFNDSIRNEALKTFHRLENNYPQL